ncbi:MAG: DUF1254 domain-containing protein [Symploca sp. SIO2D2]|nr:DUF1254 domain-containing protein [Symploca sp. SIO2D2]
MRGIAAIAIAVTLLLSAVTPPVLAAEDGFDWEEEYAYTLGVQAFIYAYPWAYMADGYWTRMTEAGGTVNQFYHYRDLKDETHTQGGGPNNDTLYSQAVIYLGDEPLILSVPAIDRYYTMELVDYRGDNFAYVGERATGQEAGNYALIGPNWEGELPADVQKIEGFSSTPWGYILGRTLVTEEERRSGDLTAVQQIQDQYKLTPLSQWLDPTVTPSAPDLWKPYLYEASGEDEASDDPLAYWKNINHAMGENPPDPYDNSLLALFAEIGIGPDLDVELQSDSIKRGLERASTDGLEIINDAFTTGYAQKPINGWNYPPPETGRPSASHDWLVRAIQAQAGFVTNDPIEAIYINASLDGDGNPLSGANRYELRFEDGEQPEVNAFWSITMYTPQYNLVGNPIDRYSVGDRSGMTIAEDGSLTISIQHNAPSECPSPATQENCPNWLPAPEGNFFMFLRLYLPGYPALSQWWEPPGLTNLSPDGDAS